MKLGEKLCVILFIVIGFVSNGQQSMPEISDHVQVFMLRGLLKALACSFSSGASNMGYLTGNEPMDLHIYLCL